MIQRCAGVVALGFLFVLSTGRADEVEFYRFRTEHSRYIKRPAKFEIKVLETSRIDSSVNELQRFRCKAYPTRPDAFDCRVFDVAMLGLKADEIGARQVLTAVKGKDASDHADVEAKDGGVFQFTSRKNDRIFHVVLNPPKVGDDSMECELAVIAEKSTASLRCRSEFNPERNFIVRDIPFVGLNYHFREPVQALVFGAQYNGSSPSGIATQDNGAAKAQEIISNIEHLKNTTLYSDPQNIFNVYVVTTAKNGWGFLGVNESMTALKLRGRIHYIPRGVNRRSGD